MLVIFVAVLLGGCAVGPDYRTPLLATPTNWSRTGGVTTTPPTLTRWWLRLRDPLLNQLVTEAVEGNLDVATAGARVREARASYRQAVGALFPTIANSESARLAKGTSVLSAASGGTNIGSSSSSIGSTGTSGLYQAGFDASWEFDLFGANRRAVEAAAYGIDASDENLRAVLLTLVGDVTSNYVEARGHQARIALARRTALSQDETTAITRNRLAAGTASSVDLATATGQAATTRAGIPTLETAYAQTVHRLSVLTGRPPAALWDLLARPKPIPAPKLPVSAGLPADVLLTRPDVRLAERRYAQSTARIGQSEAALYPSVSLTGNIATSGTKLGDLGRNSSISWSLGPTLTVPIFNAGKLRAAVEIAQAQRDQQFLAYQASVLTALKDVEDALVSLSNERARSRILATSTTAYRQAVTLSQSLYRSGSSSFLDVLTAERSLYGAEDALLQSRVRIVSDYIALNKALGSGWDGEVDALTPEVIDVDTGPHPAGPIAHRRAAR
ncbi:MAG: efflux transporter outer membrane subunit [Rhodopseudomonas palustris]|uniref:Efflux transporter outer membrane subunit n=1 Tax=Rhodopseudomonas palustris TaxID=1076 RepID=A0A933VYC0_RHOPL|nr:efflux transporter outer membrane subunit [Rhodopseudomonas palustris]